MNSHHSVWKVLLLVLAAFVIIHIWPAVLVPFVILGALAVAIGAVLTGGLTLLLGLVFAILIPLAIAAVAIIGATSPLWLPVLIVIGIVALAKRSRRPSSPNSAV